MPKKGLKKGLFWQKLALFCVTITNLFSLTPATYLLPLRWSSFITFEFLDRSVQAAENPHGGAQKHLKSASAPKTMLFSSFSVECAVEWVYVVHIFLKTEPSFWIFEIILPWFWGASQGSPGLRGGSGWPGQGLEGGPSPGSRPGGCPIFFWLSWQIFFHNGSKPTTLGKPGAKNPICSSKTTQNVCFNAFLTIPNRWSKIGIFGILVSGPPSGSGPGGPGKISPKKGSSARKNDIYFFNSAPETLQVVFFSKVS